MSDRLRGAVEATTVGEARAGYAEVQRGAAWPEVHARTRNAQRDAQPAATEVQSHTREELDPLLESHCHS